MKSRPSSSRRRASSRVPTADADLLLTCWKERLLSYSPFASSFGHPGLPVPLDAGSPSPFVGQVFANELAALVNGRLPRAARRTSAEQVRTTLVHWRKKFVATQEARMEGNKQVNFPEHARVREIVIMENTVANDWEGRRSTREGEVIVIDDEVEVTTRYDPSVEDEVLDEGDARLDAELDSADEGDADDHQRRPTNDKADSRQPARTAPAPAPTAARRQQPMTTPVLTLRHGSARMRSVSRTPPLCLGHQPQARTAAARAAPMPFAPPKPRAARTLRASRATAEKRRLAGSILSPVTPAPEAPPVTALPKRRSARTLQTARKQPGVAALRVSESESVPSSTPVVHPPMPRGSMQMSGKRPEDDTPGSPQPVPVSRTTPVRHSPNRRGARTLQTSRKSAAAAPRAPQPVPGRVATGERPLITAKAPRRIRTANMRALRPPAGETPPSSRKRAHSPAAVRPGEALPVAPASKRRHVGTIRVLPTPRKPVRTVPPAARPCEEEPVAAAPSITPHKRPAPRATPDEDGSSVANRLATTSTARAKAIAPASRRLRTRKMSVLPTPSKEASTAAVTDACTAPAPLPSDTYVVAISPPRKRHGSRTMRASRNPAQGHATHALGSSTTPSAEAAAVNVSSRERGNSKPGAPSPKRTRVRVAISIPLPPEEKESSDDEAIHVTAKAGTPTIRPCHQPQERGYTKEVVERLPSRNPRGKVRSRKRSQPTRSSPSPAPAVGRKNANSKQSVPVVDVSWGAVVRRSGEAELSERDLLKDPFAFRGKYNMAKKLRMDPCEGFNSVREPRDPFPLQGLVDDAPLAHKTDVAVREPRVDAALREPRVDAALDEEESGRSEEVAVTMTDVEELFKVADASLGKSPRRAPSVQEPNETSPFDGDLPLAQPRRTGLAASRVSDELSELPARMMPDMEDMPMGVTDPSGLLEALLASTLPLTSHDKETDEADVMADEDSSVIAVEEGDDEAPPDVIGQGDAAEALSVDCSPKGSIGPMANVPGTLLVSVTDAEPVGHSVDRGDSDGGSMFERETTFDAAPKKPYTEPQHPLRKAGAEILDGVRGEGRTVTRAATELERLAPDLPVAAAPRMTAEQPQLTTSAKADRAPPTRKYGNDIRVEHPTSHVTPREDERARQSAQWVVAASEKAAVAATTTSARSVSSVTDRAADEEVACAPDVPALRAQSAAAAPAPGSEAALADRAVHASFALQRLSGVSVNADGKAFSEEERRLLCKRQKIDYHYQLAQHLMSEKMFEAAKVVMKLAVGLLEEEVPRSQVPVGTAAPGDGAAPSFPASASRMQ